jgi:hypothetical protein
MWLGLPTGGGGPWNKMCYELSRTFLSLKELSGNLMGYPGTDGLLETGYDGEELDCIGLGQGSLAGEFRDGRNKYKLLRWYHEVK